MIPPKYINPTLKILQLLPKIINTILVKLFTQAKSLEIRANGTTLKMVDEGAFILVSE